MIEESILKKYMEDSSAMMNDKSRYQVESNLRQLFNSVDTPCTEMKRQDFIDIFAKQDMTSNNTFYPYKSKMIDLLLWMKENDFDTETALRELQSVRYEDTSRSGIYDTYYFASYEDLFQAMQVVFLNREEFETFKVTATMVWCGITLDSAINILKSDFDENAGTITDSSTGKVVVIPAIALDMFKDYKYATTFRSERFGNALLSYRDSKYLLRSYKSEHLNKASISRSAITVNELSSIVDKKFRWGSIYQSGVYYRLHQYEQEHGEIGRTNAEVLSQFFDTDTEASRAKYALSNKYDQYCEFRDYIYS